MWSQEKRDEIRLYFSGVRNLKFHTLDGILNFMIDIVPIHNYQWEDLCYEVVEIEYNAFEFYCFDFEVFTK